MISFPACRLSTIRSYYELVVPIRIEPFLFSSSKNSSPSSPLPLLRVNKEEKRHSRRGVKLRKIASKKKNKACCAYLNSRAPLDDPIYIYIAITLLKPPIRPISGFLDSQQEFFMVEVATIPGENPKGTNGFHLSAIIRRRVSGRVGRPLIRAEVAARCKDVL